MIVTPRESVWPLAIGLLIAAAANFAGIYMRRFRGGKMALDVQHAMRTELFDSLSRLDGARQDEIHTGQLVGRSISDLNMVQGLLQWMPLTLGSLLLFVFSLVIMIILSPVLALVAVAVAPALWFISTAARKKLFPASWHAQQQVGDVAAIVDEAIGFCVKAAVEFLDVPKDRKGLPISGPRVPHPRGERESCLMLCANTSGWESTTVLRASRSFWKSGISISTRRLGMRSLISLTVLAKWAAPPSVRSSRSTDVSTT